MDHQQFRADSREKWEAVASGWAARREDFQAAAAPVSRWLVDAIEPRPGHIVLELAAGPGDTGFLALERIRPGGRLIVTDGAEAMVAAAKARAAELGLGAEDVEVRAMEAEWVDLSTASVDGVLCRWGYMLLADPEAALRETRRVLRPGGRVALAAWDEAEHNPWVAAFGAVLLELGLTKPPAPGEPTMFSFAPPGRIRELLEDAGFAEIRLDAVDFTFAAPSFDAWWEHQYDLSSWLPGALAAATPEQRDEAYDAVEARLAPYRAQDGSLRLPARTLVAVAEG